MIGHLPEEWKDNTNKNSSVYRANKGRISCKKIERSGEKETQDAGFRTKIVEGVGSKLKIAGIDVFHAHSLEMASRTAGNIALCMRASVCSATITRRSSRRMK